MRAYRHGKPDLKKALIAVAALTVGACDFNIANPNSPPAIGPNSDQARLVSFWVSQ